jgi:hypothetical protein
MKMRLLFQDGKMSKQEAINLIKRWAEHKLLWFGDSNFPEKPLVYQALNILGVEEVSEIFNKIRQEWED